MITDAWMGYAGLAGLGYAHERRSQRAARVRGEDPGELLPAVHRVASLAKRWLLSTHQGSVEETHLQSYLDEFVFRFNRRRSRSRKPAVKNPVSSSLRGYPVARVTQVRGRGCCRVHRPAYVAERRVPPHHVLADGGIIGPCPVDHGQDGIVHSYPGCSSGGCRRL